MFVVVELFEAAVEAAGPAAEPVAGLAAAVAALPIERLRPPGPEAAGLQIGFAPLHYCYALNP